VAAEKQQNDENVWLLLNPPRKSVTQSMRLDSGVFPANSQEIHEAAQIL
jgi:hypothetical protein